MRGCGRLVVLGVWPLGSWFKPSRTSPALSPCGERLRVNTAFGQHGEDRLALRRRSRLPAILRDGDFSGPIRAQRYRSPKITSGMGFHRQQSVKLTRISHHDFGRAGLNRLRKNSVALGASTVSTTPYPSLSKMRRSVRHGLRLRRLLCGKAAPFRQARTPTNLIRAAWKE